MDLKFLVHCIVICLAVSQVQLQETTLDDQSTALESTDSTYEEPSSSTDLTSETASKQPSTTDSTTTTTTRRTTTTTTRRTTLSTSPTTSVDNGETRVFTCTFDDLNPDCRVQFLFHEGKPSYSAVAISSVSIHFYRVTDVTSITAPTQDGDYCKIPYTDQYGMVYYHCKTFIAECITWSGDVSRCANGKFHWSMATFTFEPYSIEFVLPTITLPAPGEYVVRFYIMMYCDFKAGCEQAEDFISFKLNDASNENATVVHQTYMIKNLTMELKWLQQEIRFNSPSDKINLSFHMGRKVRFAKDNLLAFDQIEIFQIRNDYSSVLESGSTSLEATSSTRTGQPTSTSSDKASTTTTTSNPTTTTTQTTTTPTTTTTTTTTSELTSTTTTTPTTTTTTTSTTSTTTTTESTTSPTPLTTSTLAVTKAKDNLGLILGIAIPSAVVVLGGSVAVFMKVFKKGCFAGSSVHPNGNFEMN